VVLAVAIIIVGPILTLNILASLLARALDLGEAQETLFIRLGWLLLMESSLLVAAWFFGVRKHGASWEALGFRPAPLGQIIVSVLAVMGAAFLVNAIYLFIFIEWLGLEFLRPQRPPSEFMADRAVFTAFGLMAIVVAPLAEETFFRGFVFPGLGRKLGVAAGAVLSALLFGISHVDIGTIFPTAVLGLLFAVMYYKTRSIYASMAAHCLNNMLALLALGAT
jgi:membrane protease YdiL (CAAX protease family)